MQAETAPSGNFQIFVAALKIRCACTPAAGSHNHLRHAKCSMAVFRQHTMSLLHTCISDHSAGRVPVAGRSPVSLSTSKRTTCSFAWSNNNHNSDRNSKHPVHNDGVTHALINMPRQTPCASNSCTTECNNLWNLSKRPVHDI
eukprot:350266-Chlamydomonas_euryale.AAC.13